MGGAAQELEQNSHETHGSVIPKLILAGISRTGSYQDFSHLLELNIALGLEQGIEAGRGFDVFRVDGDNPETLRLHEASGCREDFSLGVIDHERALRFGAAQHVRDDVAAGLSSSHAGDDADVLKALPFGQMPLLSVKQQAGISARQECRGLAATQETCPVFGVPASAKHQGVAPSSDEFPQAMRKGARVISACVFHGRIFFDINAARGAGSGS